MIVIDTDAHVMESEETWSFLDPALYPRRPVVVRFPEDTSLGVFNAAWLIDEKVRLFGASPTAGERSLRKKYNLDSQHLAVPDERLKDMDRRGLDYQVIHPTFGLMNLCEDVALESALMQSYNTFLAQKCNASGGRLFYSAVVPFRDPEAAVAEIRRVAEMGSAVAVFMRGIEWDRPVADPSHFPIYEEAQRHGLAMAVHVGSGSPGMRQVFDHLRRIPGEEPFWPAHMKRLVGPISVQFGFYSLIESTIAADFPNLRWAFLEATGCEWLLGAVGSLERAGKMNARRLFDDGRVFVGCEPNEDLAYVTKRMGADFAIIGSDMPHQDEAAHEDLVGDFDSRRADLGDTFMAKLFCGNAARLYGIDPKPMVRAV
ncbi:amidohydrolase family protein [Verticiella sediminum]|uniref:Amidohydrolase family protein n=1 Tax=Verticiella sediminum TaxID=1247510 RepID=A0A556ALW4_9BURK|nr:amidohydrolase family protein [Verticiella sediminum]TSH93855.1 amidohydrolase family protein [Verticiella sediminum]